MIGNLSSKGGSQIRTVPTMEQRMTGLEHSMARCEAMLQEVLELLTEEDEEGEE